MLQILVKDIGGDDCEFQVKLNGKQLTERLKQFNDSNSGSFTFSCSDSDRRKLHRLLFKALDLTEQTYQNHDIANIESLEVTKEILQTLRIISRDRQNVVTLDVNKYIPKLIDLAGLSLELEEERYVLEQANNSTSKCNVNESSSIIMKLIQVESLKCMCNWVYHDSSVRRIFIKGRFSLKIINKLKHIQNLEDVNQNNELAIFYIRLLFLMSALEKSERQCVRVDYCGFKVLVDLLTICTFGEAVPDATDSPEQNSPDIQKHLTEVETKMIAEILKALFNISISLTESPIIEQTDIDICSTIVVILRYLLTRCSPLTVTSENLFNHATNMFVNLPRDSVDVFIPKVKKRGWYESVPRRNGHPLEYELHDVEVLVVLLDELERRLLGNQKDEGSSPLPVLTALAYISRLSRITRKYFRQEILPPLRDVSKRPEHEQTVKGQLVKLMTSPENNTQELAADFLFVLCKENVDRFVKYTGYGNAAGLLASHGLMGGKKHIPTEQYSSDDEDSDTEEYGAAKEHIDPILGAVRPPGSDPMQGMSEEDKEKSSVELAGMIGRLTELNVIKPMKLGDDGQPQELTEEESKTLFDKKTS